MIATLGATLETLAVLAAASACASLLVGPILAGVRRLPVAPAIRADLALGAAALPTAAVVLVAIAIALPGGLDLLGVRADHCNEHGGHGHLCLAHPAVATPALVALGALVAAGAALRAGRWAAARFIAARDLAELLRLGRSDPDRADVVRLDASAVLCHAAGAFSPRVLISTRLVAELAPDLLPAALEHERAHVRRRDVLARDVISVLGLLAWPGVPTAAAGAWEEAAEEAADAEAAERFGGHVLARALVAVARMSLGPAPSAHSWSGMPFVGARLTRRVEALLERPPRRRPALALAMVPALGLAIAVLAAVYADPLHHAAETALHVLLGA
ncbi:MAG: hypothetical protein Q8P41_25470 [Pseudomonadota bacterium]|nr:hypothetical protein [Pseudomonadota bacterium]